MNKLVSVIIPTYSRPTYIIRGIESVLKQSYSPIEIIIVDDNGEGTIQQLETEKILNGYINSCKVKYIKHQTNKNGSAARNTGFKNCNGDYITFLDDDDEMSVDKIRLQIEAIESSSNKKVGASYCGCIITQKGKIVTKTPATKSGNFGKAMLLGKWRMGSGSNILLKREAVERIGGFDESFRRHQDTEFAIRFFRYYDIEAVNKYLLIKHNDSKPLRPRSREYIKIEQHFLDRFANDIHAMPPEEEKQVYYNSYMRLAIGAINEPDFSFAWKMIRKAAKYHNVTFVDILRLLNNFLFHPQRR